MNLQEFKAAIESDASKRADTQEVTIREMRKTIKEQEELIEMLREQNRNLQEKQTAMSRGALLMMATRSLFSIGRDRDDPGY